MTAPAFKPEPVPLTRDQMGRLIVIGTRVPLDTLVVAFERGASPESIQESYPSVSLGDIYAIFTYCAPTVDPTRTACGSLPQTLKTQTGFHGGEMRPDEDEFDAACVRAADRRVRLLLAGGVVAAGITAYLVLSRPKKSAQSALSANTSWQ